MSSIDALNAPVSLTLAGKKLKARQISVIKMWSIAEKYILDTHKTKVRATADLLEGDERTEYVIKAMSEAPEGKALIKARKAIFAGAGDKKKAQDNTLPDGVGFGIALAVLEKDQPELTIDEVAMLLTEASDDEQMEFFALSLNGKKAMTSTKNTSGRSARSTGGRRRS